MLLRFTLFSFFLLGTTISQAQTDTLSGCALYAPNTITMQCDAAYNDYKFEVISNYVYSSAHMVVYNRWGEVVFDEDLPTGQTGGKRVVWDASDEKDGVFYYVFTGFFVGGVPFELKGNVYVLK